MTDRWWLVAALVVWLLTAAAVWWCWDRWGRRQVDCLLAWLRTGHWSTL